MLQLRGDFLVFVTATILWVSPAYGSSELSQNSRDILYEASRTTQTLREGLLVKVLPDIAVAQAKANDQISAKETFRRARILVTAMEEDPIRAADAAEALVGIAVAQGKADMRDAMRVTFEQALRQANRISELRSRFNALQTIAIAQARVKDTKRAQQTFEQLFATSKTPGTPGTIIPGELLYLRIHGAVKVAEGYWDAGNEKLAETALQRALLLLTDFRQVASSSPDSLSYLDNLQEIASLQAKMGKVKLAESTLQNLYDKSHDPSSKITATLSVVRSLLEANKNTLAEHYLQSGIHMTKELALDDAQLQSFVSSRIWKEIALAKATLGDLNGAIQADAKVSVYSQKGNETAYRIIGQLHAGDLNGAAQSVQSWSTAQIDAQMLSEIVVMQSQAGNTKETVRTFNILSEVIRGDKGLKQHKAMLNTTEQPPAFLMAIRAVTAARAATGDIKESILWARKQDSPDEIVYALLGVAEGMTQFEWKASSVR